MDRIKKLLYISLIFISFSSCKKDKEDGRFYSQAVEPNYILHIGEIGISDQSSIISNDNNLLVCGNESNELLLLKTNKSGNLIWKKKFSAGLNSKAYSLTENSNNEIFICGRTNRNWSITDYDFLLTKLNSTGDTIWTKTYGGNDADYGKNIITTSDGNLLMSGHTYSFGVGPFPDIYLVKVNFNGDTIWSNHFSDQDQEIPFSMIETYDGGYLITGTNEDNSNPREVYLLKVDVNGNKLWDKKIGPAIWKWGQSTVQLSNGNFISTGYQTFSGYPNILAIKTDNSGNLIWEKTYGNVGIHDFGYSIKADNDGGFIIVGNCWDISTSISSVVILKIDASGNEIYRKSFGEQGSGFNILKDNNGDNIITGNINNHIFIARTDINGVYL